MLLRWFRMLYHWFFGGALFCTPVLMALYYADSQDLNLDDSTRAALGMKRMTIATAHSRYVFWMVVAEMWALSIWLVYLLTRDQRVRATHLEAGTQQARHQIARGGGE